MKLLFEFEVPGDPRGYTTTTYRDKGTSSRYRKYKDYCKRIREFAAAAGVPIPLTADEENPLHISIKAYYRNGNHCDVENSRKCAVDAIFFDPITRKKGNDKWVSGSFPLPLYDPEDPRMVIIIEEYEEHEYRRPQRKRRSKRKSSA